MSVNKATVGAISFSGVTLLACLFAISSIYSEVQSIWSELDAEMDGFKVLADDLWRDMVQMGAGTPANRIRRQSYGGYGASGTQPGGYGGPSGSTPGGGAGGPPLPGVGQHPTFPGSGGPSGSNGGPSQCQCEAKNTCPPGPDGPAGEAGPDGLDGLPGQDGKDGQNAEDIHQSPPSGTRLRDF